METTGLDQRDQREGSVSSFLFKPAPLPSWPEGWRVGTQALEWVTEGRFKWKMPGRREQRGWTVAVTVGGWAEAGLLWS